MLKKALRMVLVVASLAGSFASAQQLPEAPVPLNMLWRISFGTDYATTADASERDAHAPSGVLFYVPATGADFNKVALPGVTTLYRLVNPSGTDHMDSLSPGEGGYLTEGPLMSAPAMGVYKNDPNAGMTLENNTRPDGGSYGQYDGPYSKWSVHYDSGIQPTWTFRSWIITDTLQNVINDIQQLYTFGVTSRD